ncbi:MAG: VanZ family protein [Rhizobacter sp.]|nr:VanZ family protein [Rhizobacter sp.]
MTSLHAARGILRFLDPIVHAQRRWQVVLYALAAIVCYLALTPAPPPGIDFGWDKVNHASAFVALTVSACFAYPGSRRTVILVLLGVLALGGLIEVGQYFVPGRDCDWHDIIADAAGMGVGALIALPLLRLTDARRRPAR